MIEITMTVLRCEAWYETKFCFSSVLSCIEYTQALSEFLKKKVFKESGSARNYREERVERNGILEYTVKMDFFKRKDIAAAMRTQDVGKLSDYTYEFERAAEDYIKSKCTDGGIDAEKDIRLIEPQKISILRSRKVMAIIAFASFYIMKVIREMAEHQFDCEIPLWPIVVITFIIGGILLLFDQPGGLRVQSVKRDT